MPWTLENIDHRYRLAIDRGAIAQAKRLWPDLVTGRTGKQSEGYGFVQACWHAIRFDSIACLEAWFDGREGDVILRHNMEREDSKYHDPHNRLMFLAYLRCALAVAKRAKPAQPFSAAEILRTVEEIEQTAESEGSMSVAYVRDLVAILSAAQEAGRGENDPARLCQRRLREAQRTERISVLFVDESKEEKGHVGVLSLELVDRDEGLSAKPPVLTLYPTPLLSLIARNDEFRSAEKNAVVYVLQAIGDDWWLRNCDVRWGLHLQNGEPLPSILVGNSLGGAFALGLLKLLSSRAR